MRGFTAQIQVLRGRRFARQFAVRAHKFFYSSQERGSIEVMVGMVRQIGGCRVTSARGREAVIRWNSSRRRGVDRRHHIRRRFRRLVGIKPRGRRGGPRTRGCQLADAQRVLGVPRVEGLGGGWRLERPPGVTP